MILGFWTNPHFANSIDGYRVAANKVDKLILTKPVYSETQSRPPFLILTGFFKHGIELEIILEAYILSRSPELVVPPLK